MALSQADFYAYSRATGAPVPQDQEEQARMVPEVLEFRRNQLRGPRQEDNEGFNLGNLLGIGALAAGVGAGAYGLRRGLAGRGRVTVFDPPSGARVTPETAARAQVAPDVANYGAVGNLQRNLNPPPSKAVAAPQTLTSIQTNKSVGVAQQQQGAVNASEDQMTGRMKHALQQNQRLDMSQVEGLENIAELNYRSDVVQDEPINIAAVQTTGRVPNDQAETPQVFAQNYLQQRRAELATQGLSPSRIERQLLEGPEGTRIKQGVELYAATGTPSTLELLSETPSLPLVVQPKTLVSVGNKSLEADVPTGAFYKPFAPRDTEDGSLVYADIYHTNAISSAANKLADTPAYLENPEYVAFVEQTNIAQYAMEQGDDVAALIFNRNRKVFRNGQAPDRLIPNPEHIDLQRDIEYNTYAREDVRNKQAVKQLDVERFPNLMALQNMQEGTRAFAEINPATGEIKAETLELRPGRFSVPAGTVDKTAMGTTIRGRTGAVEIKNDLDLESLRYSNESASGTYRPTDSLEGQTYTANPVIWDPRIHSPKQRTPEGYVYSDEAMSRPTATQSKSFSTRPSVSPEAALQSVLISEQVRKAKDPQAFLANLMKEKGISAIGPSSPLRYK